jgi:aryl-alcohol dehydrogenase-like predicted oxidoreductase
LEDAKRITEEYMKQAPAAPGKVASTFETPSEQREQALADAKRITEEKGVTSPEAALAWELVEELDATAAHHRTTGQG